MYQIIVYDIPDDVLRGKVSQTLKDYGFERVQYSVFTGSRTQNVLESLALELRAIIKKKEADVRFYQQCERCFEKTMVVAKKEVPPIEQRGVMFPCQQAESG